MKVSDWLREKIKGWLGIEYLANNPNERFNEHDENDILRITKAKEYKAWYIGEAGELRDFYINKLKEMKDINKREYFWGIAITEGMNKQVHSSVPNAIITTLVNAIGEHKIETPDKAIKEKIDEIIDDNDFERVVNQEQLPLTLAQGWGAFKINLEEGNTIPIIEYYDAEKVEYITKNRRIIGVIFKNYYAKGNKKFILLETRSLKQRDDKNGIGKGSYVEYDLFKLGRNDELIPCDLSEIPELSTLQPIYIANYDNILAVPTRIFFDPLFPDYGRSIFAGKLELFDDLDQVLSQASQTVRVSTPVEYYPTSTIGKNANGIPMLPKVYNRQFIKGPDIVPNGDGEMGSGKIQTTQPTLNFIQYSQEARDKLDMILTGILSPATMGIDIAKRDNAEAQREKEKITLMTRNNIIKTQARIVRKVLELCLDLKEYAETSIITPKIDYGFSVVYNEFANPTFEQKLLSLSSAYSGGALSTEKYVELLWGETMTKEEKALEVERLNSTRDSLTPLDFENESMNELSTNIIDSEE